MNQELHPRIKKKLHCWTAFSHHNFFLKAICVVSVLFLLKPQCGFYPLVHQEVSVYILMHTHTLDTTITHDQTYVCPCVWRYGEVSGVVWCGVCVHRYPLPRACFSAFSFQRQRETARRALFHQQGYFLADTHLYEADARENIVSTLASINDAHNYDVQMQSSAAKTEGTVISNFSRS